MHTYKKLQGTRGGVKNPLQHPRNEEFVQHPLRASQILYVQDGRRPQLVGSCEQGESAYGSICVFGNTYAGGRHRYDLLDSLPASYEYFITTLETMLMKELTMKHVTARLMHEMSKRKEKEPKTKMWPWCRVKAKWRSTFATRRKDMLLLRQTRPHCAILLQSKE